MLTPAGVSWFTLTSARQRHRTAAKLFSDIRQFQAMNRHLPCSLLSALHRTHHFDKFLQ